MGNYIKQGNLLSTGREAKKFISENKCEGREETIYA